VNRWKVVEVEGYPDLESRRVGVSIHVLDRARNHAVVMTFRSEDFPSVEATRRAADARLREATQ
jgi:hypothetical protein